MDGGERVVATNLSVVVDGAPLRVEGEDPIPPIEGTTGDSEQGP
jgi:hypothetical protein